jgi:hypothetical protein
MKIRTLFITAATVIALSSTAMADDHLFNAEQHGLLGRDPNFPGIVHGDPAPGQGSPFMGEETRTPASLTIEQKFQDFPFKDRCLDPANPKCTLP